VNYFEYYEDKARCAARWDAIAPTRATREQLEQAEVILFSRETLLRLADESAGLFKGPSGWDRPR
jgi:hypothetical protein